MLIFLKCFIHLLLLIIFIVILFVCFGSNIFFILAFYNFKISSFLQYLEKIEIQNFNQA